MELCAVHVVSHCKCNFHTSFGQIELVYHGTPWDVSTRWPSCHLTTATASEAFWGVRTTGPFMETWRQRQCMGFFRIFFSSHLTSCWQKHVIWLEVIWHLDWHKNLFFQNRKTAWASSLFFTEVVLELSVMSFPCRLCHWETAALAHWLQGQIWRSLEPISRWWWRWCRPQRGQTKSWIFVEHFCFNGPGMMFLDWTCFLKRDHWTKLSQHGDRWIFGIHPCCLKQRFRQKGSLDSQQQSTRTRIQAGKKNADHSTSSYECINFYKIG